MLIYYLITFTFLSTIFDPLWILYIFQLISILLGFLGWFLSILVHIQMMVNRVFLYLRIIQWKIDLISIIYRLISFFRCILFEVFFDIILWRINGLKIFLEFRWFFLNFIFKSWFKYRFHFYIFIFNEWKLIKIIIRESKYPHRSVDGCELYLFKFHL